MHRRTYTYMHSHERQMHQPSSQTSPPFFYMHICSTYTHIHRVYTHLHTAHTHMHRVYTHLITVHTHKHHKAVDCSIVQKTCAGGQSESHVTEEMKKPHQQPQHTCTHHCFQTKNNEQKCKHSITITSICFLKTTTNVIPFK